MTAAECKPGVVVETQYGVGWLLYPVPGTGRKEWHVYIDGKAYLVAVEDMRPVEQEQGE